MKKGFTLIELLAVIIILAVIALIATPVVLNVVEEAKVKADRNSVYGLIDAAKLYYAESLLDTDKKEYTNGTTDVLDYLTISGEGPENGKIFINDKGQSAIAVVYGKVCFTKNFNEYELSESEDIENCDIGIEETLAPEQTTLNMQYIYSAGMDPTTVESNFKYTGQSSGKVEYKEDYINLYSNSTSYYVREITHNEKIDFSKYSKAYAEVTISTGSLASDNKFVIFGIVNDSSSYVKQTKVTTTDGEKQIIELDLSDYTGGENRLAIRVGSYKNVYVHSIWLEPILTLDKTKVLINSSETHQIVPYIPANSDAKYTYESSDKTIATVSKTGLVTGLKTGDVTITVKSSNGLTATCDVRVTDGTIIYRTGMDPTTVESKFTDKSQINGKVEYNDEYIRLYSTSGSYYGGIIVYNEKIDFSKYSKIYVEATVPSDSFTADNKYFKFGIVNDSISYIKQTQIENTNGERQRLELDLSDYAQTENSLSLRTGSLKNAYVHSIWLE